MTEATLINLIASILLGFFILTAFAGYVEVKYNVEYKKPTEPKFWVIPAILGAAFWYVTHL
jgi:hypothetical protein